MAYYGRTLEERRALKRRLRMTSAPVVPLLRALAAIGRNNLAMPVFEHDGLPGPARVSTPAAVANARRYEPKPEDVFVATQMRCGTTWMQELVHQVLMRGEGDFARGARSHLYAVSPWIEAVNSVPMNDAPLIGTPPSRIIKTHLPASHCPYSTAARYIYVARHPVSCFASILDFNRSMLGPLLPPVGTMAAWYCSDRMYWKPWPAHVEGWWRLAREHENVLFVHFEEMTQNLGAVCDRVATLLGCRLTQQERERVLEKCRFGYMKEREEFFEMAPPTMFSVGNGQFMASGKAHRYEDVTPEIRRRILDYCRTALAGGTYPAGTFYQDLA
jgi:aryl sulfotransferase